MPILFIADPLESVKIYKDTTFSMMRELQKRGHRVSACEVVDVAWERGGLVTAAAREIRLTGDPAVWFTVVEGEGRLERAVLKDYTAVVMRKDPPFDSEYFYATHLLQQAGREGAALRRQCKLR